MLPGKKTSSVIIADESFDQQKISEAAEKFAATQQSSANKNDWYTIKCDEPYSMLAQGIARNPAGIIVASTDPGKLLATAWTLRNLCIELKKKELLTDPFTACVYVDEITSIKDIQRVFRACSKDNLPMGIATRRKDVMHYATRIYPKEIAKIYLLWLGSEDTVGFDQRFHVVKAPSQVQVVTT